MAKPLIREFPAPESVLKEKPGARERAFVTDIAGFADICETLPRGECKGYNYNWGASSFTGNMSYKDSAHFVRHGDLSAVALSDSMLSKLETLIPVTHSFRIVDDVVGGMANVPAHIAGTPLSMRRRQRITSVQAPLAIFVELVASAGISHSKMQARGAAIFALVRSLCVIRPVELYAVLSLGVSQTRATAAIKIDTAPLDLARACHVLTHASVSRTLGFNTLNHYCLNDSWGGNWAFGSEKLQRGSGREMLQTLIGAASEALYIPPAHLNDKNLTEPETWVREMIAQYGGIEMEGAA